MYRYVTGDDTDSALSIDGNGNIWSKKAQTGYWRMIETGIPQIEGFIDSKTDVIILMGINDMQKYANEYQYYSYLNAKATEWKALGANTYYVSVGPVGYQTGDNSYDYLNNYYSIPAWNYNVWNGLSYNVGYIDLFSGLINDYATIDGIHYDEDTSIRMYNIIINSR